MLPPEIERTLLCVAGYCDERRVGDVGALGFRRSTRLGALVDSLEVMLAENLLVPGRTRFLDMGCADGRVNLLLSYLTAISVGIELHDWILEDHASLRTGLYAELDGAGLPRPPHNIHLILGDTLDQRTQEEMRQRTGLALEQVDLFFTYLTAYDAFGNLVARMARSGAIFMVYGLDLVLPAIEGLSYVEDSPVENKIALYRKD
jgi:hypothetical protein